MIEIHDDREPRRHDSGDKDKGGAFMLGRMIGWFLAALLGVLAIVIVVALIVATCYAVAHVIFGL